MAGRHPLACRNIAVLPLGPRVTPAGRGQHDRILSQTVANSRVGDCSCCRSHLRPSRLPGASIPSTCRSVSWSTISGSPACWGCSTSLTAVSSSTPSNAGSRTSRSRSTRPGVHTNHKARDEHLRGRDFLWAEKYPVITFIGREARATGERTGVITGDLTLRGVTRPVSVEVVWNKTGAYPFGDHHEAIGLSARARILRSDFGMDYAVANGWVGNEVELIFEFEARRD